MMSQNVNNQFGPFEDLFKEVRLQAKKKTRRYIAIFVAICLSFGLIGFVCGRASASEIPTGYYDFETLLGSMGVGGVQNILDTVEEYFADYPFVFCFFDSWDTSMCLIYMLDDEPTYNSATDSLFGDASGHLLWCDSSGLDLDQTISFSSQWLTNHSYGYFYYSWDLIDTGSGSSVVLPANLDISYLYPDNRQFNVFKKRENGNDWIYFEMSPLESSDFVSIAFTYYDTLGTFVKVLFSFDTLRLSTIAESPSEVWTVGYFNPNLISDFKYTIVQAEVVTTDFSYGSKTISLDLVFNEEPFPLLPGSGDVTSFSTYNVFRNPGIIGANRDTLHLGFIEGNSSLLTWYDTYGTCKQPFRLRWIALPDFMWDWPQSGVGNWNLEEFYQLFEQYDVVILGVSPTIFNKFYPYNDGTISNWAGNYAWLVADYALYGADDVIAKIMGLRSEYLSLDKAHSDSTFTESDYELVGFVWTRTLFLKQISYFCGDSSERLLEFETRLIDSDDGVLTMIQTKLVNMYEQDNAFYNSILPAVRDVTYALNNLDFGVLDIISAKLDRIIGYLDFDLNIDISKLGHPWSDIYVFAKNMFEDSEPMWSSLGYAGETLYDGLEITPQYDVNRLPQITGGIPLFPTIGPTVPLIPSLTPTPTPSGG